MKKLVSITICLLALTVTFCAAAENVLTFDPALVEQMGLEGEFVALEDFGLKFYLPGPLTAREVTAEQADQGTYALFATADASSIMSIGYAPVTDAQGNAIGEMEALAQMYVASGASEVEMGELNGLPCISYSLPEAAVSGVAFLMDSSSQLTFNFAPMTDENYQAVVMAIISSIMPLE